METPSIPPPSFLEQLSLRLFHPLYLAFFLALDTAFLLLRRPSLFPSILRLWNWSLSQHPHHAFLSLPLEQRQALGDALVYGEIALPTASKLLDRAGISSSDYLLDLGSGRGKIVLLAASQGIRAEGLEIVEPLVRSATYAARDLLPLASFQCTDIQNADLSQATAFWISGTCFSAPFRRSLAARIAQAPPGVKVISVTSPLQHPRLPIRHTLPGWASWGRDLFYIQELIAPPSLEFDHPSSQTTSI